MEELNVAELIAALRSGDDDVRGDAWQGAGKYGAPAVRPLAAVAGDPASDMETARSARRAMWKIVRLAGRPGADAEKQAVVVELVGLLADGQPPAVGREVVWMVSELGGDESVEPVARLLQSKELCEDARCCLERLPGEKSLAALKAALATAPREFQLAIAQSLRARGVEPGQDKYPCQKLVPTRPTSVQPLAG
jgi:hypothetical protein